MTRKRLTREDWIKAGLKALAKRGPSALAVEPLAREMETTKGSFYWHFKDLPDFQGEVAQEWKRQAAGALVETLEAEGGHSVKLREIARSGGSAKLEPAMRAWAKESGAAARAVSEIDGLRLDATYALLREMGISNRELSHALYAAAIGLEQISPNGKVDGNVMGELVDLVLALR
ncbi:TetR/AcrR family transcriptional regulator [Rhodalgimonas zhirmunskyi]|uniref:TetR/AcrR family transcriptional regulator n=1 Tax=Rhodalgimonas zhirmunskyi TaxID=2964767 RepID=A0AAJ1UDI6_9RHOB|nr:TetR/AcrR family transcriptional regulator [Rhodoalgimonas zhirmunskyi]MDQ2095878.1 TetR/AcrR family transcriptional regulator [Rhodoalgimonas zhirmunskyi]